MAKNDDWQEAERNIKSGRLMLLFMVAMTLALGMVALALGMVALALSDSYDSVAIDVGVVDTGYHSCTAAVDMRCYFYFEYMGAQLVNVTNTGYCINLTDYKGCP